MQPPIEAMAQTLFEAYTANAGGKTHDGKPIPAWGELGEPVRSHWVAAAKAACVHMMTVGSDTMAALIEAASVPVG